MHLTGIVTHLTLFFSLYKNRYPETLRIFSVYVEHSIYYNGHTDQFSSNRAHRTHTKAWGKIYLYGDPLKHKNVFPMEKYCDRFYRVLATSMAENNHSNTIECGNNYSANNKTMLPHHFTFRKISHPLRTMEVSKWKPFVIYVQISDQ